MAGFDEALQESVVFLDHFADLPDPRQLIKVIYPLDEILLLSLLAVMAGAETFTAIAQFGKRKIDLLRRLRPFANGTPDHDRLGAVFAALDPEPFQKCFVAWVATLIGAPADVIAIDGKTSRRSYQKNRLNPIHMVSAFAARQRLVLGQVKVAQKSNEIVAIPKLLDMLAIEGAIVTIDAMGCQREIAAKIIARKADYVLALKGNKEPFRRMSNASPVNRKPGISRIPRSAGTTRSMAIMAASKPAPSPSSMMSAGSRSVTNGPA